MGAIRASSQMISYELAMGLALLAIILMNGSLDLKEIHLFLILAFLLGF